MNKYLPNGDSNKSLVYIHRRRTRLARPNGRNTFIDSFVNYTRGHFNNFINDTPHFVKPNLHMQQHRPLRKLSSNTKIVIMESDKGGAIIIINMEDYVYACNFISTGNSKYIKATSDMMETQ